MRQGLLRAEGRLTGKDLREAFSYARASLEVHEKTINSLNVFPVPDGDTGTNMSLTMKGVEGPLRALTDPHADAVATVIARESLMGARGNSGVILSQFFGGIADGLDGLETLGAVEIARALTKGADQAYGAVSNPVEGTLLTVVREVARSAEAAASGRKPTPQGVWAAACAAGRKALLETPELLPVLKEAGVVDAGGLGIVAMMEGVRAYCAGVEVGSIDLDVGNVTPVAPYLNLTEDDAFGYCTQFLLEGEKLSPEVTRQRITEMAHSTIVVGDSRVIKVHCHAYDPGAVISYAVSLGTIGQVRIENMDAQHAGFVQYHRGQREEVLGLGVVAVAPGPGIEQIFRECGATGVVPGGQTMNPSTRDLAECAGQVSADEVILLPNNANVVSAAQQATGVSEKPLHVVPTTSIPEGIAALLAFNPERDARTNLREMKAAIGHVRSGEVTRAVRATRASGVPIRAGETIAILDGELVAATGSSLESLRALCLKAAPSPGSLITLYWGGGTGQEDAENAAEALRASFPGVDVEVVFGGQPFYDFLVGVE